MTLDVEKARKLRNELYRRNPDNRTFECDLLDALESAISQHERLAQVEAEKATLRERLADYEADAVRVREDRCPSDEHHCACVVHLKREIDRLRNERAT